MYLYIYIYIYIVGMASNSCLSHLQYLNNNGWGWLMQNCPIDIFDISK